MPGGGWKRLQKLMAQETATKPVYDVIIIGAGISGLMAAYLLRDMNILVLEREARPGGRILTREQHGIHYDMGAVFGYPADGLPFPVASSERIAASPHIGIHTGDKIHYGADVRACLDTLLSDADKNLLSEFVAQNIAADDLSETLYTYLNAFFQVIHPGELRDTMPVRQQDALETFEASHYKRGNSEMLESLVESLSGKIRLNSDVRHIQQQDDHVQIRVQSGEKVATYFANQVIISTPAPITRLLLADSTISAAHKTYLQSWDYAGGTVVMLALRGATLDDFSYLVTPTAPISTIIQQRVPGSDTVKLLIYYAGAKHDAVQSLTDDALIQETIQTLLALNIGQASPQNLRFHDIQRWQQVGPVISAENATLWDETLRQVSDGIWLSGEYMLNPNETIPFGMMPAMSAGYQAGLAVRQQLKNDFYRNNYLIRASIYEMTETQPRFWRTVEEGNIAYYGLILQATPDADLQHYLVHHSEQSLWEYQIGFNPTAEDSLLVMEGLLATDYDRAQLLISMQHLINTFYHSDEGAFHTVLEGRATYWRGASIDATAQAGWMMQQLAPEKYAEQIRACADFIAGQMTETGVWESRWFASHYVTTFYAVRLLSCFDRDYAYQLGQSKQFLLASQEKSGAWQHSIIDTSTAMLALHALKARQPAIERGTAWLNTQKTSTGWAGEAILYYWYDLEDGRRLFYHCTDKGQITSAWATLALRL